MKKVFKITSIAAIAIAVGFVACNNDDDAPNTTGGVDISKEAAVSTYANIALQSYTDSYNSALTMQTAINSFVSDPTEMTFDAAKEAWFDAREIYGQTEAYRGANGPIDTPDESWSINNEGQLNSWPLDEGYIDYIIAESTSYAGNFENTIIEGEEAITAASLAALNQVNEQEKSVSTGWHAIEFLLWGQDNTVPSDKLAGQRNLTDYTTLDNYERRGEYLIAATDLLVADLKDLVDTWTPGGTYREVFDALDTDVALTQLLTGAAFIAGDELSEERMVAPVDSTDGIDNSGQEDEHSCFADNTHIDVWANAQGVYNVVFGEYGDVSGASLYDLVKEVDEDQAEALKNAADKAMATVIVIRDNDEPFDLLITKETTADTTLGPVVTSILALREWADEISASANLIGLNI